MNSRYEQTLDDLFRTVKSFENSKGKTILRMNYFVDEDTAARLLGYSTGESLRSQVSRNTDTIPYTRLTNRRLYDLRILAEKMCPDR